MDNRAADGGAADVARLMAEGVAAEDGSADDMATCGLGIGFTGKMEKARREAWRGVAG
jgi:hypothetical protein